MLGRRARGRGAWWPLTWLVAHSSRGGDWELQKALPHRRSEPLVGCLRHCRVRWGRESCAGASRGSPRRDAGAQAVFGYLRLWGSLASARLCNVAWGSRPTRTGETQVPTPWKRFITRLPSLSQEWTQACRFSGPTTPRVTTQKLTRHGQCFDRTELLPHRVLAWPSPPLTLLAAYRGRERSRSLSTATQQKGSWDAPWSSGPSSPTFPRPCHCDFGGSGPGRVWAPGLMVAVSLVSAAGEAAEFPELAPGTSSQRLCCNLTSGGGGGD